MKFYPILPRRKILPATEKRLCFSQRKYSKGSEKQTSAKLAYVNGIRKFLKTVCDLRSNNAEEKYLSGLDKNIKKLKKRSIISRPGTAVFVASAQLLLKFGIAIDLLADGVRQRISIARAFLQTCSLFS